MKGIKIARFSSFRPVSRCILETVKNRHSHNGRLYRCPLSNHMITDDLVPWPLKVIWLF